MRSVFSGPLKATCGWRRIRVRCGHRSDDRDTAHDAVKKNDITARVRIPLGLYDCPPVSLTTALQFPCSRERWKAGLPMPGFRFIEHAAPDRGCRTGTASRSADRRIPRREVSRACRLQMSARCPAPQPYPPLCVGGHRRDQPGGSARVWCPGRRRGRHNRVPQPAQSKVGAVSAAVGRHGDHTKTTP